MARVLLTIGEVGVAIEIQERLERAGHTVTWDTERRGGIGAALIDVAIIPGGSDCGARIAAWRKTASVPAMVVLGSNADLEVAKASGVVGLTSSEPLLAAIESAIGNRFGTTISENVARAALSLSANLADEQLRAAIIAAGRSGPPAVVRAALESRRQLYVTATALCGQLRAERVLDVPEIEIASASNGAVTLERVIAGSQLEALEAGQRVWSLASAGALRFDSDPPDDSTSDRRRVRALRNHIRARTKLTMPTAYDVLDVTRGAYVEDVEDAVRCLGYRYAPTALATLDLADLAGRANEHWEKILESRAALYYEQGQKELEAFIDQQVAAAPSGALKESWGRADMDPTAGRAAFARGQAALSAGEVFKALSEMASAARAHPSHPVYEAYLSWARYRSDVARGADRAETARRERTSAEAASLGRRPFAQALVALGLLCVADGDAAAAQWHLTESLALNPELPAAKLILARLS